MKRTSCATFCSFLTTTTSDQSFWKSWETPPRCEYRKRSVSQSSSRPWSAQPSTKAWSTFWRVVLRCRVSQCEQPSEVTQWGVNGTFFFAIKLSRKITWRFMRRVMNFTCHMLLHSAWFVHHCGACQLWPTSLGRLCRVTFASSFCAHKTNTIHVVNRDGDLKIKWLLLFYAGQKLCMLTSPRVCRSCNHVQFVMFRRPLVLTRRDFCTVPSIWTWCNVK